MVQSDSFPVLPVEISKYWVEDRLLLVAPKVPAWLVVDVDTFNLLDQLRASQRGCGAEIPADRQALRRLRDLVFRHNFIERAEPAEKYIRVQAHLTNRCNLRCPHCYVSSGLAEPNELDKDAWFDVCRFFRGLDAPIHFSVSGGEPTLVKWLPDLMRYAKMDCGFQTAVLTNGLLLSDEKIKQLAGVVDSFAVSLDGASAETHDAMRGRGTFAKTVNALHALLRTDARVGLNICVRRSNAQDLMTNLGALLSTFDRTVDVDLASVIPEGRALEFSGETLPPDEVQANISTISKQLLRDGWAPTRASLRENCGFGTSFVIYANGDVSPCITRRFRRGNIRRDGVEGVFADLTRLSEKMKVQNLPECKSCGLNTLCGGKCHLPQVRAGAADFQNECSEGFKEQFRRGLTRRFDIVERQFHA
ncbi:MAG: radical SAM protein [Roseibium sp.]|nr:radical SAM protein [Roseibium sp.]